MSMKEKKEKFKNYLIKRKRRLEVNQKKSKEIKKKKKNMFQKMKLE